MTGNNATAIGAFSLAFAAGCLMLAGTANAVGMLTPVPATATTTAATGMPLPDCNRWKASTQAEQTAYIVGVANAFALEVAYATKVKRPDLIPGEQAAKALSGVTIADVDARITAWCDANPSKANTPIIGVIWVDMVKPKLAPK
jgi:hypothetical protein